MFAIGEEIDARFVGIALAGIVGHKDFQLILAVGQSGYGLRDRVTLPPCVEEVLSVAAAGGISTIAVRLNAGVGTVHRGPARHVARLEARVDDEGGEVVARLSVGSHDGLDAFRGVEVGSLDEHVHIAGIVGCPTVNNDDATTEVDVVRLIEVEEPVVVGISRLSDSDGRRSA